MSEWNIVTTIIALSGLYFAFYTPMSKNIRAMTELTMTIKSFAERLEKFEGENHRSHQRIFTRLDDHEERINEHEIEITKLKESN